ncbi:MAG: hypothetical protein MUC78_08695, partial [Bacteroidales bacterium]|nr:hypothetical protein [Bacteroidales bacterium]
VHHFATFARVKTGELNPEQRIDAFASLGQVMREAAAGMTSGLAGKLSGLVGAAHLSNPWFTPENVTLSLRSVGETLTRETLTRWLSGYPDTRVEYKALTVGVVMAGNIPMAGFHDFLCVLITGNRLHARLSTKDEIMMQAVAETLLAIEPRFSDKIHLTSEKLTGFDIVIATGSNNSSRYFDYYFRNIPSIIRRNRNSIAVIDGSETDEELVLLGNDIFSYFGLGCRNVSKLFLPDGYDIIPMAAHWASWKRLREHHKYAVNYDHNKAVMIVNRESFTDTGFSLLRNDSSFTPPMAVVNYEYYNDIRNVNSTLESHKNLIQCVAGHGRLPFGKSQQPELWDYADNIDTIEFILKKKRLR